MDLRQGEFPNNILFVYLLLRQLDSRLSLVMIAERMDESLVLLAHQVREFEFENILLTFFGKDKRCPIVLPLVLRKKYTCSSACR